MKLGPVFIDGVKFAAQAATACPCTSIRAPTAEHCELAGMRDTIDAYIAKVPSWLPFVSGWLAKLNWPEEMRKVPHDARVDQSVRARFGLANVVQCAGHGPYRPETMRHHDEFGKLYPPA